jgi:aryl-alcohol dehydrogenase-like predicted oxidoreductase
MKYRQFGSTNPEVSEICFGPMRFSARFIKRMDQ